MEMWKTVKVKGVIDKNDSNIQEEISLGEEVWPLCNLFFFFYSISNFPLGRGLLDLWQVSSQNGPTIFFLTAYRWPVICLPVSAMFHLWLLRRVEHAHTISAGSHTVCR